VNLHTTGDPIVPFSQAGLYADKVIRGGTADRFTQIDIERFGHCTFEAPELLSAFDQLWQKIGPRPAASRMSLVAR
jgi:hypothetical protein